MGMLTADRNTEYSLGDLLAIPVAAGARIFAGAMVCSDEDGWAVPAADRAGLTFEGIATAGVDNTERDDGYQGVVVRRRGRYLLDFDPAVSARQSRMSKGAFAQDDHTVSTDEGQHWVRVGRIDRIEPDSHQVWVAI